MKVMAILFRVVFSFVIVLALACYLQVSPTISLADFSDTLTPDTLLGHLQGVNGVTISLAVILLLGIFSVTRVLEAAWNVIFCAAMLVLLACGSYALLGASIALPHAIFTSETVRQFCDTVLTYQVPIALATFIFATGWVCASACGRVAITTVISYALWYGVSELFFFSVQLWSDSANPVAPEALSMILGTPWVIAAVPGAFFLIYALLMSLFETFITRATPKPKAATAESGQVTTPEPETKAAEAAATPAASKPEPVEPRQKTMRLSVPKPVNKEPKVEEKAEAPATPKEESPAPAPEAEIPAAPETPAEIPATTTPEAEAPVEATPVPEAPAEESPEKEQDKVTC